MYSSQLTGINITCVTDRYYLGSCVSNEVLSAVYNEFVVKREQFLSSIEDCTYLSKGKRKRAENYINSFYTKYKTDDHLLSELTRYCKVQN